MTNDIHIRLCAVESLLGIRTNTCTQKKIGRFTVSNLPPSRPKRSTVSNLSKRDVERNMKRRMNELIQSIPQHRYSRITRNARTQKLPFHTGLTGSI